MATPKSVINEWYFDGGTAYLLIRNKKGTFEVVVDTSDAQRLQLQRVTWTVSTKGYVISPTNRKADGGYRVVWLHRLILNAPPGRDVDHWNGDKLNNKQSNLRLATRTQNNANQKVRRDNTSGVKGVSWQNRDKCWSSYAQRNGVLYRFGCFKNKAEAITVRRQEAEKLFGAFARH